MVGGGAQFPALNSHTKVNNGSDFSKPFDNDRYSIHVDDGGVVAASVGRRWQNDSFWLPSYSIGVLWQYFFQTRFNGQIMQYSLPEFTNYDYHLNFTSNIVLAAGKINLLQYGIFSPYVHGGIGSSFNHFSNYKEEALADVTPRDNP